jgi:predicted MFS family arabinose efflux permease
VRPLRAGIGRALFVAVAVFGVATAVLGVTTNYVIAFASLVVLGGADAISVFIRATLVPLASPEHVRGRVAAVENVFIGASNELGAFESGTLGQLVGAPVAIVVGGVATVIVAAVWSRAYPELAELESFPDPAGATT